MNALNRCVYEVKEFVVEPNNIARAEEHHYLECLHLVLKERIEHLEPSLCLAYQIVWNNENNILKELKQSKLHIQAKFTFKANQ